MPIGPLPCANGSPAAGGCYDATSHPPGGGRLLERDRRPRRSFLPGAGPGRSLSELSRVRRRFLDAPSPSGYLEEWTARLAAPVEQTVDEVESVLTFHLGDEWLALPVRVLIEVTTPRPVHRVPYRAGLLAGLVNIRGELYLCVHLARLLGIEQYAARPNLSNDSGGRGSRP